MSAVVANLSTGLEEQQEHLVSRIGDLWLLCTLYSPLGFVTSSKDMLYNTSPPGMLAVRGGHAVVYEPKQSTHSECGNV